MIAAGELRHRIAIQKRPTTKNTRGRPEGEPIIVGQASAKIMELNGTEADKARQMLATATHRVWIRHRRNLEITTKLNFVFRGRRFQIGHVGNVDQVNSVLPCLAVEEKP